MTDLLDSELLKPFFDNVLNTFPTGVVAALVVLTVIYFTQDRAVGIGRWTWNLLSVFGRVSRKVLRLLTRYRLQGRVNSILKEAAKDRPFLASELRLEWIRPDMDRETFFTRDRMVVRIEPEFDRDSAFISTVFLFVSRSLLVDIKRFLSDDQREALNIYFVIHILDAYSHRLSQQFVSEYVPRSLSARSGQYLSAFHVLERHAFFEDVLVRELDFLGSKVAGEAIAPTLSEEVDAIIDKLLDLSQREPGEDIGTVLERSFIRTAIMPVGRRENLAEGTDIYEKFIRGSLIPRQIDSIYLISDAGKLDDIGEVTQSVSDVYSVVREVQRRAQLLSQVTEIALVELKTEDGAPIASGPVLGEDRVRFSDGTNGSSIDLRGPTQRLMGRIKFITDDGWGFIALDDPNFSDKDAWFSESSIVDHPGVLRRNERVECRVRKEQRGLRASDIRLLGMAPSGGLGGNVREEQEAADAAHQQGPSGSTTVATRKTVEVDADALAEPLEMPVLADHLASVLNAAESGREGRLPLSVVGGRLRQRVGGFSHAPYGYRSLLLLVEALAEDDSRFFVGRFENGHPFVALGEPESDDQFEIELDAETSADNGLEGDS